MLFSSSTLRICWGKAVARAYLCWRWLRPPTWQIDAGESWLPQRRARIIHSLHECASGNEYRCTGTASAESGVEVEIEHYELIGDSLTWPELLRVVTGMTVDWILNEWSRFHIIIAIGPISWLADRSSRNFRPIRIDQASTTLYRWRLREWDMKKRKHEWSQMYGELGGMKAPGQGCHPFHTNAASDFELPYPTMLSPVKQYVLFCAAMPFNTANSLLSTHQILL